MRQRLQHARFRHASTCTVHQGHRTNVPKAIHSFAQRTVHPSSETRSFHQQCVMSVVSMHCKAISTAHTCTIIPHVHFRALHTTHQSVSSDDWCSSCSTFLQDFFPTSMLCLSPCYLSHDDVLNLYITMQSLQPSNISDSTSILCDLFFAIFSPRCDVFDWTSST